MLTAINNALVINKRKGKIETLCFTSYFFFSLKFVEIIFIYSSYDSVTLSQVITE